MAVSIVIPTYERMDTLPRVLQALEAQSCPGGCEIVVVDDGSADATPSYLATWCSRHPHRVLRQANRGPAQARNVGVAAAAGGLVAFLGDDTVPREGWLAAHVAAHASRSARQPIAVLGYTDWHPSIRRTPFLEHINEQGLQFGYALIEDPERVPFNFFYTSNLSLPRELLLAEPMDTGFPYPAWEDTELSYRLEKRGLTLVYEPAAVVDHDHPTDFERFTQRQERAGYSAVVFFRRHPELGPFLGLSPQGAPPLPAAWRQRLCEGLVRTLQYTPMKTPRLWEEALRYHYIRGLQRGWQAAGAPRDTEGETT